MAEAKNLIGKNTRAWIDSQKGGLASEPVGFITVSAAELALLEERISKDYHGELEDNDYHCGICVKTVETRILDSKSFVRPCSECLFPRLIKALEILVEARG